jgi:CHAD domain-containing protein
MKKQKAVAWSPSNSAVESARNTLPQLAERFFAAGRKAAKQGRATPKELHAFRLHTKRFRYTLELFQPLYGPGLKSRLAELRRIQQYLGDMNDCVITEALLRAGGGKKTAEVKQLLARLDSRKTNRARRFLRYWRDSFDPPAQEKRWHRYLRSYAGHAARSSERK